MSCFAVCIFTVVRAGWYCEERAVSALWPDGVAGHGGQHVGWGPWEHGDAFGAGNLAKCQRAGSSAGTARSPFHLRFFTLAVQQCWGIMGTSAELVVGVSCPSQWGAVWERVPSAQQCMGGHRGHAPYGTTSSQRSHFLVPHSIRALFRARMTLGNLHPSLKRPFQGRWNNTKSTPLKPPGPQPHGRAALPFPHQLWARRGLGAGCRDSAPRWSREPLGLRDGLGAPAGDRETKCPFSPGKMRVCERGGECPRPRGAESRELAVCSPWSSPARAPLPRVQEAHAFPSRWVYVRHACALLIRVFFFPCSWVFPPLPTPAMHL